jgi:predicted nucleotidyltransferase
MTEQRDNPVFLLAKHHGLRIEAIETAWSAALRVKRELRESIGESEILTGDKDSDRSFVVFGSLARNEFTGEGRSDVDWTLLVDGLAMIQDIDLVHELTHLVEEAGHKTPNKTGPFGNLAFSHDLIHQIGGSDDTNANTTQRLLLLLESASLYGDSVRSRVIRNILSRYVLEDESFLNGKHAEHVPRFLLNDVARYWRTMTVDFQTKKRERENKGFALRNVKLRFSRKLLYLAGLITCLSFSIWRDDEDLRTAWDERHSARERGIRLVSYLEKVINTPPLELVSKAFLRLKLEGEATRRFLSSYEGFVRLLSDSVNRDRLENLAPERMASDSLYQEARKLSHEFQSAIGELFLRPESGMLSDLTIKYGVF